MANRPAGMVRAGWDVVVCCASGPSFDVAQAEHIAAARAAGSCRVIAVNDNWRRVPSADVLYACDGRWWIEHAQAISDSGFAGERWTQDEPSAKRYGMNRVRHVRRPGLTKTEGTVHGGGNSGYQAINLAFLFGARRIVLVGYDMQATGGSPHWFGAHASPALNRPLPFAHWLGQFADLARDLAAAKVDVVNASAATALRVFRREPLERALPIRESAAA